MLPFSRRSATEGARWVKKTERRFKRGITTLGFVIVADLVVGALASHFWSSQNLPGLFLCGVGFVLLVPLAALFARFTLGAYEDLYEPLDYTEIERMVTAEVAPSPLPRRPIRRSLTKWE